MSAVISLMLDTPVRSGTPVRSSTSTSREILSLGPAPIELADTLELRSAHVAAGAPHICPRNALARRGASLVQGPSTRSSPSAGEAILVLSQRSSLASAELSGSSWPPQVSVEAEARRTCSIDALAQHDDASQHCQYYNTAASYRRARGRAERVAKQMVQCPTARVVSWMCAGIVGPAAGNACLAVPPAAVVLMP